MDPMLEQELRTILALQKKVRELMEKNCPESMKVYMLETIVEQAYYSGKLCGLVDGAVEAILSRVAV